MTRFRSYQGCVLLALLDQIQCDDGGDMRQRLCLHRAFGQLIETPTGARLAQEHEKLKLPARVGFGPIAGTRQISVDGRRGFHGPRGITHWASTQPVIVLNDHYLWVDQEIRDREMPATLGHELLGHAPWYARAQSKKILDVFHLHALNEINARLVGWTIELETHQGLGDREAWSYIRDPAAYMAELKLRHPYYALTYSTDEMGDALGALSLRLAAAQNRLIELYASLRRHRSWYRVIDHFIMVHYMDHNSFRALSGYMTDTEAVINAEIGQAKAALEAMALTAQRFQGEVDQQSVRFLARHSKNALFDELQNKVEEQTAALSDLLDARRTAAKSGRLGIDSAHRDHWHEQVTFEELVKLYEQDHEHFKKRPEPELADQLRS